MKKLGDIGEIVVGLTYSPNDVNENGVLVLRSSNVQNRTIAFEDNVYVISQNYNPVKENDILICVRNGSRNLIGKNALIKKEHEGLAFGAFMTVYRSPFNKFLFQWFDSSQYKEIVYRNLGATINSINGSDLKKFEVPFPDKAEQIKISQFLTCIDERIETQNKIIEHLESLINALKSDLLNGALRFKNEAEGFFPIWEQKSLMNIAFKKSSNISANTLENEFGEYKIYGATGVIKQISYFKEELPYISIVKDGAGVGRLHYCEGKTSVLGTLDIIMPQEGIDLKFLYYLLGNIDFTRYVTGSTIPHIYFKDYSAENIKVPCLEEQKMISACLFSIDMKIEIERDLLKKYSANKKYILNCLFT